MPEKISEKITNHTFYIGGSPCSGKSTVCEKMSKKLGLHYYKIDDHEQEHLQRVDAQKQPIMSKWQNPNWNEIWMRPVDVQVDEEFEFYRERFEMILDDLQALKTDSNIIVEGAALLPELLNGINVDFENILYMIPTREFQYQKYSEREFIHYILKDCDDPKQAFNNWMERDVQFGEKVKSQANLYGYKTMIVDGSKTEEETFLMIKKLMQITSTFHGKLMI